MAQKSKIDARVVDQKKPTLLQEDKSDKDFQCEKGKDVTVDSSCCESIQRLACPTL